MRVLGPRRPGPWGLVPALTIAFVAGSAAVHAQESTSYRMDRVTIASTANAAGSASFAMIVTFGQEGPVGSVSICNSGGFQSTGFWSIAGDTPAPIFLDVVSDPGDPAAVDLSWTGSAQLFEIFRGEMAGSVASPSNSLMTTPLCAESDTPPQGFLYYYVVLSAGN